MDRVELKRSTQKSAINVIRLIEELPAKRLSNQLLRCSSSVGANYRSAYKGKLTADFINKIVIVEQEADEFIYWFELMEESGSVNPNDILT